MMDDGQMMADDGWSWRMMMMARFVVTDQVANANGLKDFNWQGYRFDEVLSNPKELVFTRPKP